MTSSPRPAAFQRTRTQIVVYAVARAYCRLLWIVACRFRLRGRPRIPRQGGALICANHQSMFDPVVVGLCCDRRLNYLARKSLFNHRGFARLIRFLDAIPIEREGLGLAGIKETIRRLKRGELVLMFPEGTRTADGDLQPLKPGLLAIARRCRVPLIPVGLDGAFDAWPRQARWPRLATMAVVIGRPIDAQTIAASSDDDILQLLHERMADALRGARSMRRRIGRDGQATRRSSGGVTIWSMGRASTSEPSAE